MSKSGEIIEEIGLGLIFLYLIYIGFFFLSGQYTNKKIECVKNHESVEARYNIMTGCWYWDEIAGKMVKDRNNTMRAVKMADNDTQKLEDIAKKYNVEIIDDKTTLLIKKIDWDTYITSDGRKFQELPKNTISVGEVRNGYRFKGGDPNKKENWEKLSQPTIGEVRNGVRFLGYNPDGSMKFEKEKTR